MHLCDRAFTTSLQPRRQPLHRPSPFSTVQHLEDYHNHILSNKDTLLCRFFGVHRVKVEGKKLHLLVLGNVFDTDRLADTRLYCQERGIRYLVSRIKSVDFNFFSAACSTCCRSATQVLLFLTLPVPDRLSGALTLSFLASQSGKLQV